VEVPSLRVLITESSDATADADSKLWAAGHMVQYCTEEDARAVWQALSGQTCPLDSDPIDVVVEVRPRHDVAGVSDGVRCASRRGIPTIIANKADVVPAFWGRSTWA
jgi:hypothetical protein